MELTSCICKLLCLAFSQLFLSFILFYKIPLPCAGPHNAYKWDRAIDYCKSEQHLMEYINGTASWQWQWQQKESKENEDYTICKVDCNSNYILAMHKLGRRHMKTQSPPATIVEAGSGNPLIGPPENSD